MSAERFDAFISYARVPSTELAVGVQTGLEKFAKPWNRLRAIRVFRDDASMSANSALWSAIERALQEAEWFILLATPQAAASTYVNNEVDWWVRRKSVHRVLVVHAAGTIAWDNATGDFTADSTAVPPALRGAYREEPRWVDMTWFGVPGSLQAADPRFVERIADLSAAVRNIERDTLIGENVRQHRKARRLARAAIVGLAALLVAALVAGGLAFVQRSEAVRQRDTATQQSLVARAGQLAATAVNEAETDLQSSLLLAATAYRTRPDIATLQALHEVLTTTPALDEFVDFGAPLSAVDGTPDANVIVAGTDSGTIYRDDRHTGARVELMDLPGSVRFLAVSDDGRTVAASAIHDGDPVTAGYSSAIWRDGEVTDLPGTEIVAMSPSGATTVALPAADPSLENSHFEVRTNGQQTAVATEIASRGSRPWVQLPDDHVLAAMDMSGNYIRASPDGRILDSTRGPMKAWMLALGSVSANGSRFGYATDLNTIEVWDLAGPLPASLGDEVLTADTGGVQASEVALDAQGTHLAVAGDGEIVVSAVRSDGASPHLTALRGAGANPHSLKFLSDDILLSASGSAAAVWDLRRTVPMATVIPMNIGETCNACGPPQVVVSPDAHKVMVIGSSGTTSANLQTGFVARQESSVDGEVAGELETTLAAAPSAVWLDADRVFVYAPSVGGGYILSGPRMSHIDQRLHLPRMDGAARVASRADGVIVAAIDGTLLLIDPSTGSYDLTELRATNVTANGAYAVNIGDQTEAGPTTHVEVVDTYTQEMVRSVDVDGRLVDFAAHTSDGLAFLRMLDSTGFGADTEVLAMDLRDGQIHAVGRLGHRMVVPEQGVVAGNELFAETNGVIVRYDLRDASRLSLLPVTSAVKAWNALGLPQNGRTLMVASEPTQSLLTTPASAEDWMQIACRTAGRATTAADIDGVVTPLDGLELGCR